MAADNKLITLTKHLEQVRSRLTSGLVPDRQKNRAAAYREWLKLEVKRTEKKFEGLKPGGVK